jgi:hypothetical protein
VLNITSFFIKSRQGNQLRLLSFQLYAGGEGRDFEQFKLFQNNCECINTSMLRGSLSPGMTRLRVADGGDGIQIWKVAVGMLNELSRAAEKGQSSNFKVGRRANNFSP